MMSTVTVSAGDAGRTCPYCRFPLDQGVAAERCDDCHALYHEDCWRASDGCAVVGCAPVETPESAPAPVPPPTASFAPVVPPALPPDPVLTGPTGQGPRSRLLAGALAVIAVIALGLAIYAVQRDGSQTAATVTVPAPGESRPSTPQEEDAPAYTAQRGALERMAGLVSSSLAGRTAVREGRYGDAIANREAILRGLSAITGAHGDVAAAQRSLQAAMEASLAADRAYAAGTDPTASDASATAYKREFVARWNALAARYDMPRYSAEDI